MSGYGTTGIAFMFWNQFPESGTTDSFAQIKTRFDTYAESVHRILQTTPMERPHQPEIGCLMRRMIFEPNDFYLRRTTDFTVRDAINRQEPRLNILSVNYDINVEEHRITVHLQLIETDTQTKFVLQEEFQL